VRLRGTAASALDTTEQAILSEYWHSLPKLDESGIFIEAGVFSSTNKLTAKGVGLIDTVIMLLARKKGCCSGHSTKSCWAY
jgi:hypothetical protein